MGTENAPKENKFCVRYHEATGDISLLRGESLGSKDGYIVVRPATNFEPRRLALDFQGASPLLGKFTARFQNSNDFGWWNVPYAKVKDIPSNPVP